MWRGGVCNGRELVGAGARTRPRVTMVNDVADLAGGQARPYWRSVGERAAMADAASLGSEIAREVQDPVKRDLTDVDVAAVGTDHDVFGL